MNTTTLNMTTLDGGVIIKKGGATPNPPSGGDVLEGEYYLVRPNGWYWKFTDEYHALSNADKTPIIGALFLFYGTMYECIYKGIKANLVEEIRLCYRDIGMLQYASNTNVEDIKVTSDWIACAEGGPTIFDFFEGYEFESIFQAVNILEGEMTEAEFEAFILENFFLQRITKEEYESLITA